MTKKEYLQPTMTVVKIQQTMMLCVSDVKTSGLGGSDDNLTQDGSGDIGGAMGRRRRNGVWDEEEEEDW